MAAEEEEDGYGPAMPRRMPPAVPPAGEAPPPLPARTSWPPGAAPPVPEGGPAEGEEEAAPPVPEEERGPTVGDTALADLDKDLETFACESSGTLLSGMDGPSDWDAELAALESGVDSTDANPYTTSTNKAAEWDALDLVMNGL